MIVSCRDNLSGVEVAVHRQTMNRRDERDAYRLLISAYHPDTLRYPAPGPVTTPADRLRHALTWNVFKTLEQIAPTLWMRPLIARCGMLAEGYGSAPHVTKVTCWSKLEPAPSARLRRARRGEVPVDVIIDTDDTVIALLTPGPAELQGRVVSDTVEDGLLDVAEAVAWLAGTRAAYVGVILPVETDVQFWGPLVQRRAERVHRVMQSGDRWPANMRGIGVTNWPALHELLSEVAESNFIAESEKRFALTAVAWMAERLRIDVNRQRLA